MAFEQRAMKVNPATYARVTTVKFAIEAEKQRQVTYAETLDYLVDYWETRRSIDAQRPILELHMEGVIERGREAGR